MKTLRRCRDERASTYTVATGQHTYAAADLSEQISTASKECLSAMTSCDGRAI
jgi:hypothetical protein